MTPITSKTESLLYECVLMILFGSVFTWVIFEMLLNGWTSHAYFYVTAYTKHEGYNRYLPHVYQGSNGSSVMEIMLLKRSPTTPYFLGHYGLKCSVFECEGIFCSRRTGLTLNLLMSADVCEDRSFTCAMEENQLKRSEEFTNDWCQLPMLT